MPEMKLGYLYTVSKSTIVYSQACKIWQSLGSSHSAPCFGEIPSADPMSACCEWWVHFLSLSMCLSCPWSLSESPSWQDTANVVNIQQLVDVERPCRCHQLAECSHSCSPPAQHCHVKRQKKYYGQKPQVLIRIYDELLLHINLPVED